MYAMQTSMLRAATAKAGCAGGMTVSAIPADRMPEAAADAEYRPIHGLFRNRGGAPANGSAGVAVI
jgi:hypothetical protein